MSMFSDRLNILKGNMTTVDFAQKCGICRATAGFYLGGVREPSVNNIEKICKRCDCSADWLLGLTDCRTPDAFDLLPEQTRADLQAILNSPKRDKLLRLCAEVLADEHQ